jgi:hypothetical protein
VSRAAVLVAGFWLGLIVASGAIAAANFRIVERVLGSEMRPELTSRLASVAPDDRRAALRHLAGEINRWMFQRGSWLQLALGVVLVALLWSAGGASRVLAGLLLLLTAVQALALAAEITSVGRAIEFLPRPLPADLGRRFGMLHGAYVLADLVKLGALGTLAALLLRRP